MQDDKTGGVPIRTVKSFLSKIPSVVTGNTSSQGVRDSQTSRVVWRYLGVSHASARPIQFFVHHQEPPYGDEPFTCVRVAIASGSA